MKWTTALMIWAVTLGWFAPPVAAEPVLARATQGVIDRDTGYDPDDLSGRTVLYDIRRSTRTLFRIDHVRYLRVTVLAEYPYGPGNYLAISTRLDTHGGSGRDFRMIIGIADQSGHGCSIHSARRDWSVRGHLRFRDSGAVSCRVPTRGLHIRRPVRWKLTSYSVPAPDPHYAQDHAPDGGGWYS